jgi:dTDP-4-amino-4,6-dideoxygalactose transaminase
MPGKLPLIDLIAQYRSIQSEIDEAIRRVLESGQFILGPEVKAFETEASEYLGVKHSIGVASGTDALILSLRALDIKLGDEVIVPAYTFFGTIGAVLSVGAKPVFVDIDPDTYCIDPQQVPQKITTQTRAIIPVHLYGHPADMASVNKIAENHDLKVIEDNAQALGAEYNGRRTGSFGDMACLSFFPSKNLGACGDGGMIVANDDDLAARLRMLRTHGWRKKYFPEELGFNSRLDELQAAILRTKLHYLDKWNNRRRKIAQIYDTAFARLGLQTPTENAKAKHVYHLYVIQIDDRDNVRNQLATMGIASAVYYPQAPYLAEPCRTFGYSPGDFPIADQASRNSLAIPIFPEMTSEQCDLAIAGLSSIMLKLG